MSNSSSTSSSFPLDLSCIFSGPSSFIFTSYNITNILLLLPLCIFILYRGVERWWPRRSMTLSHSDSFTYHMVTMELVSVLGSFFSCCGVFRSDATIVLVGFLLTTLTWFGEVFFHILTCVERYLAVVHPITYLSLRQERGVRIRNVTIACVWLLCFSGMGLIMMEHFPILDICFLLVSLTVLSFCSLSVLRVLIRPGPGKQGGDRERVDQSKRRAFYTILAILGVLVLRFAWNLVWAVEKMRGESKSCVSRACEMWFNLPCSLVLPLLFLHREGKPICCKKNIQRGKDVEKENQF